MAVYVITFHLNKEKPNHAEARTQFLGHLERYENTKDPGLDSVRFVSTRLTASQLSHDLQHKLDHDDKLVVAKLVSGDYYGWLHEEVWAWISARVS